MPDPTLIPLGNPPQPSQEAQAHLTNGDEAVQRGRAALATGRWLAAAREFRTAGDAYIDGSVTLARDHRLDDLEGRT